MEEQDIQETSVPIEALQIKVSLFNTIYTAQNVSLVGGPEEEIRQEIDIAIANTNYAFDALLKTFVA